MAKIGSEGFTVLEVVVALAVAGLFIIGIGTGVSSLNTLNARTEDLAAANALAESTVEDLRNLSFIGLPADGTVVDFTDQMPATHTRPRAATYEVTDVSDAVKQVDVRLEFFDFGRQKVLNYRTYIGELGVGQY